MSKIDIFSKYGDPRKLAAHNPRQPTYSGGDEVHGMTSNEVAALHDRMDQFMPQLGGPGVGAVQDIMGDILPDGGELSPGAGRGLRAAVEGQQRRTANVGIPRSLSTGFAGNGTYMTQQRPYQPEFECLTYSTPIVTATGTYAVAGEIRVGDKVMGSDGHAYEVRRQASAGVPNELVEIETWGGEVFTCTTNHRWPAWVWARACLCGCGTEVRQGRCWAPNHYRPNGPKTVYKHGSRHRTSPSFKAVPEGYDPVQKTFAEDLRVGDCLLIPRKFDAIETDVSENQARLLGYWVAEGSVEIGPRDSLYGACFNFGAHEEGTWAADTTSVLQELGVSSSTSTSLDCGQCRVRTVNDRGALRELTSSIVSWLVEHGGRYSNDKCLSAEVMRWPVKQKRALLVGLLRGDGSQFYATTDDGRYVSRSFTVTYATASAVLARQVTLILAQCGFPARVVSVAEPRNRNGVHYRVDVKGGQYPRELADLVWGGASRACEHEKSNDVSHACMIDDDFIYVPIKRITRRPNIEHEEVFTIAVSAEDQLYCLGRGLALLTSNSPDRQQYPVHRILANRYWRLFYKLDPVIGNAVDLYAELPWGHFELTGEGVDGSIKDSLEFMVQETQLRAMLPYMVREYLITGEACPHLFFDDDKGVWTYIAMHNPDQLEVIDAPFIKMDPVVEFVPDGRLQQVLMSNNALLRRVRDSMPRELLVRLMARENIPLSPINFTFIPRKLHPYDTRGTSIISRMWRVLMYEDAIFNASIATARRHAGPLKVAKLGTPQNGWIPGPEHERRLLELLAQAELDVNAWLVYHYGIQFELVGTTERIMSIDKHWEFIERVKLIALGISKSFLHGEVTYASAATGLTVFLQRLKALRQMFEAKWLIPKYFKTVAKINKWVKPTEAELAHRVRVRRASHEVDEDLRWIVPRIEWDRSLDPSVDSEMINAMSSISQAFPQVKFSPSTLMATVNRDFEEEQKQYVKDMELQQQVFKGHEELLAPPGSATGGGGLAGGGGGMMPGIPPEQFGEDLGGGPGDLEETAPPPEAASVQGGDDDARGRPKPAKSDLWDAHGRYGAWTRQEVEDLISSLFDGQEPEDRPWIDAWHDPEIRYAVKGGDADEIWNALEQWLVGEDYPSRVITDLVDVLSHANVVKKRLARSGTPKDLTEEQLLDSAGDSTNVDLLSGAP